MTNLYDLFNCSIKDWHYKIKVGNTVFLDFGDKLGTRGGKVMKKQWGIG